MNIRKALPSDYARVLSLIYELEEGFMDIDSQASGFVFNDNLNNPNIGYFVVEDEGNVIAFASIHIQNILHHTGPVGEIQEFVITQGYRGCGIGTALINELMSFASEKGCVIFEVTSNMKRSGAHRFYERQGLSRTHYKLTKTLK